MHNLSALTLPVLSETQGECIFNMRLASIHTPICVCVNEFGGVCYECLFGRASDG